ncbi:MAG: hypothetical protein VX028_04395 [Nanoarchaeota archaeon]|nr:hypothetical protein [Nanoarchaeota archaeon]MEC8339369.1 hypothetical protein [Nanoarchaeota archaeon]
MKNIEETSLGDSLQYVLSIAFLFLIALLLLTGKFGDMLLYAIGLLVVQLLISLVRFKVLHVILEVVVLIFMGITLIAFIPIFIFKVLAWLVLIPVFILGMLDLMAFKSKGMYQQIYVRTPNFGFKDASSSSVKSKPTIKKKKNEGAVDADFKEK